MCTHKSIINITNCYNAKLFAICFYVACCRSLNSFEMFRIVKMDTFSLNERINLLMASCCADDANSHILLIFKFAICILLRIASLSTLHINYCFALKSHAIYSLSSVIPFALGCNALPTRM